MSEQPTTNRELLDVMETLQAPRTSEMVQRTRWNVMEAAGRMQKSRAESRHQAGIALMALLFFLLLATPAIWSFSEAAFSENSITDCLVFILMGFAIMLSTTMGALFSHGRRRGIRE